jgi:hypothetical protein
MATPVRNVDLARGKTWTETITNNGTKILEEVRKMRLGLDRQLDLRKEAVVGLRECSGETAST